MKATSNLSLLFSPSSALKPHTGGLSFWERLSGPESLVKETTRRSQGSKSVLSFKGGNAAETETCGVERDRRPRKPSDLKVRRKKTHSYLGAASTLNEKGGEHRKRGSVGTEMY